MVYVPITIHSIPTMPVRVTFSPNISHDVTINSNGENDKSGRVLYNGDICKARMYKTIAMTSRGGESKNTYTIWVFTVGIPLIRAIAHNTGSENSMRPAAIATGCMLYEYLTNASPNDKNNPHNIAYRIHREFMWQSLYVVLNVIMRNNMKNNC